MEKLSQGLPERATIRSGWGNGKGCRTTAYRTLYIAVVTPMPMARMRMTVNEKPADRCNWRRAALQVCIIAGFLPGPANNFKVIRGPFELPVPRYLRRSFALLLI